MTEATRYYIPREPGRWRAISLAAVVHLALLVFLWVGIRWQNETPVAVEAEIWSPQAQQAAPKPEPQPEPEQPQPAPKVQEAPRPQPAAPVERQAERPVEKPTPDPDIALEQERKKREQERKRRLAEEREEEEKERLAAQKKQEQQRAEAARKKEQDLAKAEADRERRREDELKRKQADAAEKKREAEEERKREQADAENKRKLAEAAEKKKRAQAEAAARADELRREEMSRMASQAAGTGGSGEAAHTSGPSRGDAGYAAKVAGKIRSNTVFNVPEDLAGNPAAEFSVDLLPDGSVRSIRKVKSSSVPGFDDAVKRAIEKSQPFPADKTGRVPSGFTVSHKPKDQ